MGLEDWEIDSYPIINMRRDRNKCMKHDHHILPLGEVNMIIKPRKCLCKHVMIPTNIINFSTFLANMNSLYEK